MLLRGKGKIKSIIKIKGGGKKMILTVTPPIYKSFNDLCQYEESNVYSLPFDLNIEIEVICRLVGGLTENINN